MAQFIVEGLDGLIQSFESLEKISDDEWDGILNEQAIFLTEQLQTRGRGYGVGSGQLLNSIKPGKPKPSRNGGRQVVVAPRGKRRRGKKDPKTITNAEIAFHVNYGGRFTPPVPFWSDSVELSRNSLQSIAEKQLDEILRKRNL